MTQVWTGSRPPSCCVAQSPVAAVGGGLHGEVRGRRHGGGGGPVPADGGAAGAECAVARAARPSGDGRRPWVAARWAADEVRAGLGTCDTQALCCDGNPLTRTSSRYHGGCVTTKVRCQIRQNGTSRQPSCCSNASCSNARKGHRRKGAWYMPSCASRVARSARSPAAPQEGQARSPAAVAPAGTAGNHDPSLSDDLRLVNRASGDRARQ